MPTVSAKLAVGTSSPNCATLAISAASLSPALRASCSLCWLLQLRVAVKTADPTSLRRAGCHLCSTAAASCEGAHRQGLAAAARRAMAVQARSRKGYAPLRRVEEEDDPRFTAPPEEVPWSSIALALFLTIFGVISFVLAWLHFTQMLFGKEQAEIGFTVVGLLTFIPGFYHTRIAYYAWRGRPGFSYSDIPQY